MLTLSRRVGEAIVIDTPAGPVRVVVVSIDRGKIRLGFQCAREIVIMRQELLPVSEEGTNHDPR